jgi:hypothetical protein
MNAEKVSVIGYTVLHKMEPCENLLIILFEQNAKAVPLQTTEVLGWRGSIAPTHSRPLH